MVGTALRRWRLPLLRKLQKISKSFRPGFRNLQKTVDFFPIPAENYRRKIRIIIDLCLNGPDWRRQENSRRQAGAVHGHQSPSQNWPPRRATQQAASKAISSWAPRSKGADKGILWSARPEQTMNTNCKLVKKNLIRLSARLSGQLGAEAMRAPGSSYRDLL